MAYSSSPVSYGPNMGGQAANTSFAGPVRAKGKATASTTGWQRPGGWKTVPTSKTKTVKVKVKAHEQVAKRRARRG